MKRRIMNDSRLTLLGLIVMGVMQSGMALGSELIAVAVNDVFIPQGFDDNDDVSIVLDGYLSHSCFKLAHTAVEVEETSRTITVTQFARKTDDICIQALIPFSTEVRLGILPEGTFTIVSEETGLRELMPIVPAPASGTDNYFYAPVDHVSVHTMPEGEAMYALLEGRFTNTCMRLTDVKIEDHGKSINILPIMHDQIAGEECHEGEIQFKIPVDLPRHLTAGRHLVHVRSMSGQAHNVLFNVAVPTRRLDEQR